MSNTTINKKSLDFLKDLSKHNDRDWFAANKDRYTTAYENITEFADSLLAEMNRHDNIETPSGKKSMYRIYKDVRFSKEKVPYNTHWSAGFRRATKKLRGGYYFRIEPGNSGIAGGFGGPNAEDMKRIREDIDANYGDWQKLLSDPLIITTFGQLEGEKLATAPRGYDKNHPAIELLRYKQFILRHRFTDDEVLSDNFLAKVVDAYQQLRPFFDHLSEVLTNDANGISLF